MILLVTSESSQSHDFFSYIYKMVITRVTNFHIAYLFMSRTYELMNAFERHMVIYVLFFLLNFDLIHVDVYDSFVIFVIF